MRSIITLRRIVNTLNSQCHRSIHILRPVKLDYTSYLPSVESENVNPLIVIHGLFGSRRNLETVCKNLSNQAGMKIYAVDCRNHGKSPHNPVMDYPSMANDVEQFMHDLQLPVADILGHSMGGKVAMTLALNKPELISRLIIEDIAPRQKEKYTGGSDIVKYIDAFMRVKIDQTEKSLIKVRRNIALQLKDTLKDPRIAAWILTNIVERDGKVQWQINLDAISENIAHLLTFPIDISGPYPGPVDFIGGSLSFHIGPQDQDEIKSLFPEADIQYIQGAGHWIHAEKPKEFLEAVLQIYGKS